MAVLHVVVSEFILSRCADRHSAIGLAYSELEVVLMFE